MKSQLIRIGNSQGIRIPKALIDQCGFSDTLEMVVENGNLIITSYNKVRSGWEDAFREMAQNKDDDLLFEEDMMSTWDETEWEWK